MLIPWHGLLTPGEEIRAKVIDDVYSPPSAGRIEHRSGKTQDGFERLFDAAVLHIQIECGDEDLARRQHRCFLEIGTRGLILQLVLWHQTSVPVDTDQLLTTLIKVADLVVTSLLPAEKQRPTCSPLKV